MENKMTPEDLLRSCCSKSEYRPNLQRPFLQGDYVIATDAHAILAIPKEECDTSNLAPLDKPDIVPYLKEECTEFMELDFKRLNAEYERLVNEYGKLDFKCKECDGDGKVDWEYHDNDWNTHKMRGECPICHGEGVVSKDSQYYKEEYCICTEDEIGLPIPRLAFIVNTMRTFGKSKCMLLRQAG